MKKIFTLLVLLFIAIPAFYAQTPKVVFGKVDIADLELKQCDFEKDANAMVLYDKGDQYYDDNFGVIMDRHKRIKVFNDKGKDEANIRIEFYSGSHYEFITGIQVQTINLVDGKPEITKLEKKLIYTEVIDKNRSAIVFAFPNVKPGSILEYQYRWQTASYSNLPNWYFQSNIPTRYSEYNTLIPEYFYFQTKTRTFQQYVKNTTSGESKSIGNGMDALNYNLDGQCRAMANIPSLTDEPYMTSRSDNLQCVLFQLTSIRPPRGFTISMDTWAKVGGLLADDEDFGGQLKRKLTGEEAIIAKAKTLNNDDQKIAYIYNEVKNRMKWNDIDRWYTNDGTAKAWDKQTGNSSEINIALYHLLKQSGLKVYPMIVSTRDHGKVNFIYPFLYQFNRAVAYIPVDSTRNYILDATDKYNTYNETPHELLNSYGFYISKDQQIFDLIFIDKKSPVNQAIVVNAEIKPGGKMEGSVEINSASYYKHDIVERYKKDGEEKYKTYLKNNDNTINITSLKLENMEVDTLPLSQKINFQMSLTGSDGDYIYFSPNLFNSAHSNPFLNENRTTDIDFGYRKNYSLTGIYKIPAGYKVDALPKSITLVMPDESISFRRVVAEQDGSIIVRFVVNHKKTIYFKENYPQFFDFYKKMNEMLNEQIVLKKG
jgi:hypothetical protein